MAMANPESCHAAAIATGTPSFRLHSAAGGKTAAIGPLSCQTTLGSVIQPGLNGSDPLAARTALIPVASMSKLIPVSGLKIHRQATPVVMNDNGYGKRKTLRKKPLPRI